MTEQVAVAVAVAVPVPVAKAMPDWVAEEMAKRQEAARRREAWWKDWCRQAGTSPW